MKNIYLLYGENIESINDFQKKIKDKYLGENIDDFSYIKFNMSEMTIENLIYECQSSGFFSNKKLIVAENCVFLESKPKKNKIEYNINLLEKYILNPNKDVILILINNTVDSRKKIIKQIKELGEIKIFKNFTEEELYKYILKYFKDKNIVINNEAINFILLCTNKDFFNIKQELSKIDLYYYNKEVTELFKEDIEFLISKNLEYDVFSLTNELFSKKYYKLREIYTNLKLRNEEPIFLLSLISSQIRTYYKVKILLLENFSQKDIANKLNIHPYRVQLATEKVNNLKLENILKCIVLCCEFDKQLKTSYIDKYTILYLFINKIIENIE